MGDNSFSGISFGYDSKPVFEYREKNMCDKWDKCNKSFEPLDIELLKNDEGVFIINGHLKGSLLNFGEQYLKYWASNSPTYSTSYSGSGLPYPNEKTAFEGSDNIGMVKLNNGKFIIKLHYPNSYYANMGTKYVPPQIKLRVVDSKGNSLSEIYKINLGNGIPFRSLTWNKKRDWNKGPLFFCSDLPVRTQEQILRESAYPKTNVEPDNFWGMKPPN